MVASLAAQTADSRSWPSDDEFHEALVGPGLYKRMHRARLKTLLVAMENALRSDMVVGNNLLDPGDAKLNIEHVMPQKWKRNWPLPPTASDIDEEHRDAAIHRLGNLTLATTHLNLSMSHNSWKDKRGVLQSHSLVRLTSASILASPENFDLGDHEWTSAWDEERIAVRTEYLAGVAEGMWPRPPLDDAEPDALPAG